MFYLPIFLFGLSVGSFLNVVVLRLRNSELICGRSHCPSCQKILRWHELVPVLSFLCQGGRCRHCQARLSWQYPLTELGTGILFLLIFSWRFLPTGPGVPHSIGATFNGFPIFNWLFLISLLISWILASFLILIFIYDLKYSEIPDVFIYPPVGILLIVLLLGYCGIGDLNFIWNLGFKIWSLVLGILVGGGFFGLQYLISRGRWIGAGDIGLGILMGFILGWPKILAAFFSAYVGGAIVSIFWLILRKKTLKSNIPFGVFLVPATFVAFFWGERIIRWYLSKVSW